MEKTSKFSFSTKTVMFIRMLFGHYHELSSSKFICALSKVYCLTFCAINTMNEVKKFGGLPVPIALSVFFGLMEFVGKVLFSIITKGVYFSKYCREINKIDSLFNLEANGLRSKVSVWLFLLITCLIFPILTFAYQTMPLDFFKPFVSSVFTLLSTYTSNLITVMVFELFYNRIKSLRKLIQSDIKKSQNENDKIMAVRKFIIIYRKILNNMHSINNTTKTMVSLNYCCTFVLFILLAYFWISFAVNNKGTFFILSNVCTILPTVIMACVPALLAEAAANEVDEIKSILASQLLEYNDQKFRTALYDALDYIEVRPTTITIWPNFPINMSLCLDFINLTAMYFIGLLQFEY